jgi:hypothetical protein
MDPSYWKGTIPGIQNPQNNQTIFVAPTFVSDFYTDCCSARQLSLIPQLLRSSFCYCCCCCSLPSSMLLRRSRKLQILWVQRSQLAHHSHATPSHLAETGVILQPQLGLGLGIRARRWVTRVLKRQRAHSVFLFSRLTTQRRGFVQGSSKRLRCRSEVCILTPFMMTEPYSSRRFFGVSFDEISSISFQSTL